MERMKEPIAPLKIRLPLDAMAWLRERARQNRRSLNAEIGVCLDEIRHQLDRDAARQGGAPAVGREA